MKGKRFLLLLFALYTIFCLPLTASAEGSREASGEGSEDKTIVVDLVSQAGNIPSTINNVVVKNIESGQLILNTSKGKIIQPGAAAKLMTALIAYERIGNLNTMITVPDAAEKASYIGQSGAVSAPRLGLKSGTKLSARDLLQAVLVCSANDACVSLAVEVSGTPEAFVELMNAKAEELGCSSTVFTNCTGLYSSKGKSSAEDIAVIAEAVFLKYELVELSSEPKATVGESKIHSKNYLLSTSLISDYYMKDVRGLISGQTTDQGGYCLITSAEKDGLSYIFVVTEASGEKRRIADDGTSTRYFESGNAYDDMKALVPWATTSFSYVPIVTRQNFSEELPVNAGKESDYVMVVAKENIELLLPGGTDIETAIEKRVSFENESLDAPVAEGQIVGTLSILLNGEEVARTELITKNSVAENALQTFGQKALGFLKSDTMKNILFWAGIVVLSYIVISAGAFIYRLIRKYINASKD